MAQIKTETFTATSEADVRAKAAAWKKAHPTIKIIAEHKPIAEASYQARLDHRAPAQ
jgi:hypothetical protein